jgi:CRISPR/Cas system CMR subunit Cmr4 (Cas7 group RAMP superfamily)
MSNEKNSFYLYNTVIKVRRHVYAPYLSNIKILKNKEIERLEECYKEKYGEDQELLNLVKHIDNAFKRDSTCTPFIGGEVVSGALRSIGYENAIVRGIITIPYENISIETRIVNLKQKLTTINTEYVEPGTEINAKLLINLQDLKTTQLYIGGKRAKGYGLIEASFSLTK